jgi:predicted ribosome quality control (RQC) complex YloA/Tae2 family protein
MDFEGFSTTVLGSDSDIVRTLAARVGLGGEYAEGILRVSNHDLSTVASTMSAEELGLVFENMRALFEATDTRPFAHILRREGVAHSVLPVELPEVAGDVVQPFETFNEAVDAYFAETVAEVEAEDVSDEFMGTVDRLRHQADQQRRAAEDYEAEIAVNIRRGDLIYANFKHCESSLRDILEAKDALGWKEVERRVAGSDLVKELDTYDGYMVLTLEDGAGDPEDIRLRFNLTVPENAEYYYERAKRGREKSAGAKAALGETLERLERAEEAHRVSQEEGAAHVEAAARPARKRERRRDFWFERFRWTLASDGTLIVAGRDSGSNERVVKKYLKDRDRYCHADFQGAPSVVVKDPGEGVTEVALEEACAMAAIYSKAWSAGRASADAYWVLPEQVSKTPQSGEFVPKGGFIIRGKRNYVNDIEMRVAVGWVEHDGERLVMGGPLPSVKGNTDGWVELVPSNDKKDVTAKEVARRLGADLENVVPVLPPGGCRVVASHGLPEPQDPGPSA